MDKLMEIHEFQSRHASFSFPKGIGSWNNPGEEEWPFEISVDLTIVKPKVAFWSGEERKYYPENPGHSKLAQVFMGNSLKANDAKSVYITPPAGVQKPISKLGYGIGSLLSERFPNLLGQHETRPDPGDHQKIQMYPHRPNLYDISDPRVWRQCKVAFGSIRAIPRFPVYKRRTQDAPGPGHYNIFATSCGLKSQDSFGSKHCVTPTTVTICTRSAGENCTECGMEQKYDYYRTKGPVKHDGSKRRGRAEIVVLCRECYCKAYNGKHKYWNKRNLPWLFHKCRNCSYAHEHSNLPIFVGKALTKDIKKLSAKESILGKYFPDFC